MSSLPVGDLVSVSMFWDGAMNRMPLEAEQLDIGNEVLQAPAEPIDLPDQHDVEPAKLGVAEQALELGALGAGLA
jgi:hypothetical protein